MNFLRKVFKIASRTLLVLVFLILVLYGFLHLPSVQTWLVKQATVRLSKKLGTKVSIERVDFAFFNKLEFDNLLIEDQSKDTLLFAGAAKVNVNDWFFRKDTVILKYIGLSDGLINLKRKDSIWNYKFLTDYFSGGSKKNGNELNFDFKRIALKNIRFNNIDQWRGEDIMFSIKKMEAEINLSDILKKKISIESLDFDRPQFSLLEYDGNRPRIPDSLKIHPQKNTDINDWDISIKKLTIKDGEYKENEDKYQNAVAGHFDELHFNFSTVNAELQNIRLNKDTLLAKIKLSTKERGGLNIKNLESDFRFTPSIMEFSNLDIKTDKSHIGNYYAMHYDSFDDDMSEFISKVNIIAHIKGSEVHTDDLALFAPELKGAKRLINIDGNFNGAIDNFSVSDMKLKTSNSSVIGHLDINGLPEVDGAFFSFISDSTKTNITDLKAFFPELNKVNQINLNKIGNLYYTGDFTGFIGDFVVKGKLSTDLGELNTDIKLETKGNDLPKYTGTLSCNNFRLGTLTGNKNIGNISLSGKVDGKGYTKKDLNVKFNGSIGQFEVNGYNYRDIKMNGDVANGRFNGHLSINDPNLNIKSLDGKLNFLKDELAFDLNADLQYANFKNINLTNNNISFSGQFSLNFTGNNIDNFLGAARIYDATLKHDNTTMSFDSLRFESKYVDNQKHLSLFSNEIEADLTGNFKIMELPDAFKFFLSNYYPSYIERNNYRNLNQNFSFNIKTKKFEDYIKIFDDKISGLNNIELAGNLSLANHTLNLKGFVPEFGYDGKSAYNINFESTGNDRTLMTNIDVGDIQFSDHIHFPNTKFTLNTSNDLSEIKIKTSSGTIINDAEINARIETLPDGANIKFDNSALVINNKTWAIEKGGEVSLRKNFIYANNVNLSHENQKISIATETNELNNQTDIITSLNKINLQDFVPFAFQEPDVKGILTGDAHIKDVFGKPLIEFKGRADSLNLDDKYVGNVNISTDANLTSGLIGFNLKSDDTSNVFNINGNYNFKDSSQNQMITSIDGEKINLSILEPYLKDVFNKIEGTGIAKLIISGGPNHKYITGTVSITNALLKVDYTQCTYFLENQKINFEKDNINFDYVRIKDSKNNSATINGKIRHNFFDEFFLDNLRMETPKLELLNTTRKDNFSFYGNVIGKAKMSINGPLNYIKMNIEGEPNLLDSSHIFINTSDEKESNAIDYIEFVQYGREMEAEKKSEDFNIIVNLSVIANPSCKVDLILDEETGDVIKSQGKGRINITVGNVEPLSISGSYTLSKGEYNFNFQTFLKKPFTFNTGTINWNGDPLNAMIDIDAEYLAKNVDISSLSTSEGYRPKEDVKIISHLTGNLQNPQVKFDFLLSEGSDAKRDDIIVKRLAEFRNDDNEMNKQVTSLLLFNSFLSKSQNLISQGNATTLIAKTIGGVVSGLISNAMNKELEKITKGILSTYLDINTSLDLQKSAAQLQANIKAGLKILLSSRLIMTVGGNLDYNNASFIQQLEKKGLITPDINMQWIINKDGSLRVVGFNRSSVDFTYNQRNRSGLQLSYRKDINKFSDIFKSRKKIASEEVEGKVELVPEFSN